MKLIPKIQALRKERNVTQMELGVKIGKTPTQISSIENGRHMPSIVVCYEIAKALGCRVDALYEVVE